MLQESTNVQQGNNKIFEGGQIGKYYESKKVQRNLLYVLKLKCQVFQPFFEKQSFAGVLSKNFSEKSLKLHTKTFRTCNFIKKEILVLVFSCEFCETSQNFFLHNNCERVFLDIRVMQRFVILAPICNLFSHFVIFAPILPHFVTPRPVPVINPSLS